MTDKKYWLGLAVVVALAVLPALPVQAENADYRIDITGDAATSLQELDITEHHVSEGDTVSHQIFVDNHTPDAHQIQLKNIEVITDSILLDKLDFEFIDNTTVIPFNRGNMVQAYGKKLFTSDGQDIGSFTLKMSVVGDLDNRYQGTTCTLRYTFEIINLNPGGESSTEPSHQGGEQGQGNQGQADNQGEQGTLPTTLGEVMKGLLPTTGEGKMLATTLVGMIVLLGIFLVVKNRKKEETTPEKEGDR